MSDCSLQHFVHFLSSSKATMTFMDTTVDIIAPMFAVCASMFAVLDFYFFPMQVWFTGEDQDRTIHDSVRKLSQLLSQDAPGSTQTCSECPTWSSLRSEESLISGVPPIVYGSPAELSCPAQLPSNERPQLRRASSR